MVEQYIDGREINVAILPGETPAVLPIAEIDFGDLPPARRYLDYSSKWLEESEQCQKTVPRCPAVLSDAEQANYRRDGSQMLQGSRVGFLCEGRHALQRRHPLRSRDQPESQHWLKRIVAMCVRAIGMASTIPGMIDAILRNAMRQVKVKICLLEPKDTHAKRGAENKQTRMQALARAARASGGRSIVQQDALCGAARTASRRRLQSCEHLRHRGQDI